MKKYEKPILNITKLESEEITTVLISSNYNALHILKNESVNYIYY